MTASTADKIRAIETYIASYGAGDLDGVVSVFADDATVEDPVGTPPIVGGDAIRTFMARGIAMGAKLTLLGAIRCAGEYAVFPFVVTLHVKGKPTRIEVIDQFRFNDAGKVVEMRAFFGTENITHA